MVEGDEVSDFKRIRTDKTKQLELISKVLLCGHVSKDHSRTLLKVRGQLRQEVKALNKQIERTEEDV